MVVTWPFVLLWATVGTLAGIVLAPSTACWLNRTNRKRCLADLFAALLTGAAFAVIGGRPWAMLELLAFSVFVAIGVQLAVIDARTHRLPRALIWPTWIVVTSVFTAETVADGEQIADLVRAMAGSAVLGGFYVVIAAVSRGGIGAGDVRMSALVGCVLGWHSWPALVSGTLLAFITAGIITVAFKRDKKSAISFGPAMLLGAIAALLT